MEDEGDRNDIVGLPMLLPDNNLWKTLHDSHGNPIMGLLYPRSDYSNISIAEVSSLFPRQNFFSSWIRVIECKDNEFAFQSAWKCMICMRQMNVCLKFIDHKTSYIFGKNLELTDRLPSRIEILHTFFFFPYVVFLSPQSYVYNVHISVLRGRG